MAVAAGVQDISPAGRASDDRQAVGRRRTMAHPSDAAFRTQARQIKPRERQQRLGASKIRGRVEAREFGGAADAKPRRQRRRDELALRENDFPRQRDAGRRKRRVVAPFGLDESPIADPLRQSPPTRRRPPPRTPRTARAARARSRRSPRRTRPPRRRRSRRLGCAPNRAGRRRSARGSETCDHVGNSIAHLTRGPSAGSLARASSPEMRVNAMPNLARKSHSRSVAREPCLALVDAERADAVQIAGEADRIAASARDRRRSAR